MRHSRCGMIFASNAIKTWTGLQLDQGTIELHEPVYSSPHRSVSLIPQKHFFLQNTFCFNIMSSKPSNVNNIFEYMYALITLCLCKIKSYFVPLCAFVHCICHIHLKKNQSIRLSHYSDSSWEEAGLKMIGKKSPLFTFTFDPLFIPFLSILHNGICHFASSTTTASTACTLGAFTQNSLPPSSTFSSLLTTRLLGSFERS